MPTVQKKPKWLREFAACYRAVADAANKVAREAEIYDHVENETMRDFLVALHNAMPASFNVKGIEDLYAEVCHDIEAEEEAEARAYEQELRGFSAWLRTQQ